MHLTVGDLHVHPRTLDEAQPQVQRRHPHRGGEHLQRSQGGIPGTQTGFWCIISLEGKLPYNPDVRPSVRPSVGWSVCHIFLKDREVLLPYAPIGSLVFFIIAANN